MQSAQWRRGKTSAAAQHPHQPGCGPAHITRSQRPGCCLPAMPTLHTPLIHLLVFPPPTGFILSSQAKMTLLRSAPVLGEALRRTDLRRLAYASERRSLGRNVALYEQGAAPAGLELIVEGQCKVGWRGWRMGFGGWGRVVWGGGAWWCVVCASKDHGMRVRDADRAPARGC